MMELKRVPLEGSGFRSKMLNDYLSGETFLKKYYTFSPLIRSFSEVIQSRKNFSVNRVVLQQELTAQHAAYFERFPEIKNNVEALGHSSTFTITTGHQLCLAGGPLFFVYKLITAINLAKELRRMYPEYNFIPVYWMATEDHDFDEIASLHVNGEVLQWQHASGDATGRLDTQGLPEFFEQVNQLIKDSPFKDRLQDTFRAAYSGKSTMAEATREFVMEFFGAEGLLVIDADTTELKKEFRRVIAEELLTESSCAILRKVDHELEAVYSTQVKPREINLFYLSSGKRTRIVKSGDVFEVLDTTIKFSKEQILHEVEVHPERFSPNVILRPVYQEILLPNLAYCGGPAEIAYWLQFKEVFDHHGVFYPLLVPRNHTIILEKKPWRKWTKLGLSYADLFVAKEVIIHTVIRDLSGEENVTSDAVAKLRSLYDLLESQIGKTEVTLIPVVKAQLQKAMNGLERIERKHFAALKRKHSDAIRHMNEVMELVKPDGLPQERVDSFVTMYARYGDDLLKVLYDGLSPFSDQVTVIHP